LFQKSVQNWQKCLKQHPDAGWKHLLECYNDFITAIIKRYASDYDVIMDMYSCILEKLKENNYSRIMEYYKKKRQYNFESWLAVITRNCCIDWLRKEKGRKRISRNIKELPLLDQWIYKYKFWFNYSDDTICQILTTNHGYTITPKEIYLRIDKIKSMVKAPKRPFLHDKSYIFLKFDKNEKNDPLYTLIDKEQQNKTAEWPDSQILSEEIIKIYNKIFSGLSASENLLINLYFYRGLTLGQIARILKIKNIWKVHRLLKKLLSRIKKELESYGFDSSDIENILK